MLQRKAQDQGVSGDEHGGRRQQQPRARRNEVVFHHGSHPSSAMAEVTRSAVAGQELTNLKD